MANTFQQQSRQRKLIYGGLVVGLLSVTLFYRPYVLGTQADALTLRELDQGDADLTGSAVRLTLTGSRGLVLCLLWQEATELQKKHEWDELRILVNTIARLEPHFSSIWEFQSWNLSYNVSVESDRLRDRFFWISEGIAMSADGERHNRNNPDLRFNTAFYFQDKIGIADQLTTYRSFLQMSCVDPHDRDPARLRKKDGSVDMVEFEKFVRQHPHLVRRIGTLPNKERPEDIVQFLADNQDLPSIYETAPGGKPLGTGESKRKPFDQRFPILPPTGQEVRLGDETDNYLIAKVWYEYAQEPLPKPHPQPWTLPPGKDREYFDRSKFRLPKRPATIIFRQYPARNQSYIAERLQKEGWFDRGWDVDEGRLPGKRWFPAKPDKPDERLIVGGGIEKGSGKAWEEAYNLWSRHGLNTSLYLAPNELEKQEYLAEKYRSAYHLKPGDTGVVPPPDADPDLQRGYDAARQLIWLSRNQMMTRFPYFLAQSQVEQRPEAVTARRLFFEADKKAKAFELKAALKLYEDKDALPAWRELLINFPDFHKDDSVQEEAYSIQARYLKAVHEARGQEYRELLTLSDVLSQAALPATTVFLPTTNQMRARTGPLGIVGPFDGNRADGKPLISLEAVHRARSRPDFEDPNAPPVPKRPAGR
jgi:hypothetical protein